MVRNLACATLMVGLLALTGQAAQPVQWENDYGAALKATRSNDRPLLVVIESPSQQATAQQVSLVAESVSAEQAALLAPYDLCRIDASTEYGQKVAEVFKAKSFPHTAIIDKTGSVILFAKSGAMSQNELNATLATYKTGNRRTITVSQVQTQPIYYRSSSSMFMGGSYCPTCGGR